MKTNPYTTRLQKGGALFEDMRLLVRSWQESSSWEDQVREGLVGNLLGKSTKARAADVFRRTFAHRFLKGDPPNAWRIVRPLEDRNAGIDILKPVYYWITARSDALLHDFVCEFVTERGKTADLYIRTDEVASWIAHKLAERDQKWTSTVTPKVGRGLLAALRDFGILQGAAKKRIAPVYLPVGSFSYIAFVLHNLGFSGESLVKHLDWRLFLAPPSLIEKLFLGAHQERLLHYEAAGNLHRIEFYAQTLEEMADAVTRRPL